MCIAVRRFIGWLREDEYLCLSTSLLFAFEWKLLREKLEQFLLSLFFLLIGDYVESYCQTNTAFSWKCICGMEYLARFLAICLLEMMGSWDGQPFAIVLVPEIYAHLLSLGMVEADHMELLEMAPDVSATSVVRSFNSLHVENGIEARIGEKVRILATKVDASTVDLKFRLLFGNHGDAFLKMTVRERMEALYVDEIIYTYCKNNEN